MISAVQEQEQRFQLSRQVRDDYAAVRLDDDVSFDGERAVEPGADRPAAYVPEMETVVSSSKS